MNKIIENLWLGNMSAAYNKEMLEKNGVTHILTVASGITPKFPSNLTYKVVYLKTSKRTSSHA